MIKTIQQTLILMLCLLIPSISKGTTRSVDDAKEVAAEFFQSGANHQLADKDDLILAYTAIDESSNPICFVFNAKSGNGFVIISADESSMPVIGYSGDSSWNVDLIPYAAQGMLSSPVAMSSDSRRKVGQMRSYEIQSKLLETPNWSQEAPFNNNIPNRRLTGCVGVALAEILKFHGYPASRPASLLKADDASDYNWELMRGDNYRSGYTAEEAEAVATLVADASIAIGTDFGQSSSSAFEVKVPYALSSLFGYDSGVSYKKRSELSKETWDNVIVNEINEGRPVLYSGQDVSSGHAFVCDGYEIRGGIPYFHINWGWGGSANGYFASDALNPVVSKRHSFNDYMTIIYNIKPAANSTLWSDIHVTSDECQPGLTLDVSDISVVDSFTVRAGALKNISNADFSGKLAVALFDGSGQQKALLSDAKNFNLIALQIRKIVDFSCKVPSGISVADDDVVRLVSMASGSEAWIPVAGDLLAKGEAKAKGYEIPYLSVSLPSSSENAEISASDIKVIKGRDYAFKVIPISSDKVITVKANGFILTPDASNGYTLSNVVDDQDIDILVQNAADVLSKSILWVEAGRLQYLLSEEEAATVTDLTLFGTINADDFSFIRDRMKVNRLDISQVSIMAKGSNPANAIPTKAFSGYRSLKTIILPSNLTTFKNGCFTSAGLTSIEIPASVGTWEYNVFLGCSSLQEVIVRRSSPAWINWCVFNGSPKAKLVVPVGASAEYKSKEYWQDFKEIIEENALPSDLYTLTVTEKKGVKFTSLTEGTEFNPGSEYSFKVDTDGTFGDATMQVYANSTRLNADAEGIYRATVNGNTLIHVEFKQPQSTTVDNTWKISGDEGGVGLVSEVVNVPFNKSFVVRANAIKIPSGDDAAKFYGIVLTDKNGGIKEFISSIINNYYSTTGENVTYNFNCQVKEAQVNEGNQIRLATSYNKKNWQLVDAESDAICDRLEAIGNTVVYHSVTMPASVTGARIEGGTSQVVRGMPFNFKASAINPSQRVSVAVNGETKAMNVAIANISIPAVQKDLDITINVTDADAGDYMVFNIQEGLLAEKLVNCPERVKLIGTMLPGDFDALRANASTIIDLDLADVTIKGAAMSGNTIPENAFAPLNASSLSALRSVILPNGIERISRNAFARCTQISEITIPDNVDYIGDAAFSSCVALNKIIAKPKAAPACGKSSPFPSNTSQISLEVPKGSEESYSVVSTWWSMLNIYKAPVEAKDVYWVKYDPNRVGLYKFTGNANRIEVGQTEEVNLMLILPNNQSSQFAIKSSPIERPEVPFKLYDNGIDVFSNLSSYNWSYANPEQSSNMIGGRMYLRWVPSATSGVTRPQDHEIDVVFYYSINFENEGGAEGVQAQIVEKPEGCEWTNVPMYRYKYVVDGMRNPEVKPVVYKEGSEIKFQLSEVAPKMSLVVNLMTKVMTQTGTSPVYEEREMTLTPNNGIYTIPALQGDTWIRISGIPYFEEGDVIPADYLATVDKENAMTFSELTVSGEMNDEEFENIRENFESVETIDLSAIENETIPAGAFEGMEQLKDVIIPETVTEIGAGAFKDCENIESLTLPGVTSIGEGAFEGCGNLTSILLASLGNAGASGKPGMRKTGGVEGVTAESFRGLNPNCLIYIGSAEIPESESLNVILNKDGRRVAASDITLDGNHPFNAPASFMLGDHKISFTAEITASDDCDVDGGWKTIMLPFAPTDMKFDSEIGQREGSGLHLLSFEDENSEYLAPQDAILPNRPYLANICAPYSSVSVTFSATGSEQSEEFIYDVPFTPVPEEIVAVGKNFSLFGSYDGQSRLGTYYELNDDGSRFVLSDDEENETMLPFSVYLCANEGVTSTEMAIGKHPLWIHDPVYIGAAGTKLYRSSKINIASASKKASIYYTIDGTDPSVANGSRKLYETPLVLEGETMTLKAVAEYEGFSSDQVEFEFELKKANVDLDLAEKWNWISHNVETPVAVADFATEGISTILSQTQEVINDPIYGLVGSLSQLAPTVGYKVYVEDQAWNGNVSGIAFDPVASIKLRKGWNWIGSPIDEGSLNIDDLLSDLDVEEGDMIVGLEGFSQADAEGSWLGSVSHMIPGIGYMFFSNSDKEFVYNLVPAHEDQAPAMAPVVAADGVWSVDNHKYASVMPVVAQLVMDNGSVAEADDYLVAAFCGDECRGIGVAVKNVIMINVHGDEGDQINFRIIDPIDEERVSSSYVTFSEDVVTTFSKPFSINIESTAAVDSVLADSFRIYSEGGNIHFSGDLSSVKFVEVFDVAGMRIAKVDKTDAHGIVVEALEKGVVTAVIFTESGSFSKKVVLK